MWAPAQLVMVAHPTGRKMLGVSGGSALRDAGHRDLPWSARSWISRILVEGSVLDDILFFQQRIAL